MQTPEDKVYEERQKWIQETNRWEKIAFLEETLSEHHKNNLIVELVNWMGESGFDDFFKRYASNHSILTPAELEFCANN
jgi:antirestriction protein